MTRFSFPTFSPTASLAVTAMMLLLSSCEDNPVIDTGGITRHPAFDVTLESSWTKGNVTSRNDATDILIEEIDDSGFGEQLYLVSESENLDTYTPETTPEMSRGVSTTTETFPKSFGLSAICYDNSTPADDLTGFNANFACNTSVSLNASTWTPAGKLDWPGSGRLRFMAYAPYSTPENGITHSDSGSHPSITFTVNDDVAGQTDLLTAIADVDGAGSPTVKLSFGHALAAISIRSGDAMLAGDITRVTISGVHGSGTLTLSTGKWEVSGTPSASYSVATAVNFDYQSSENPYSSPGLTIAGGNDADGNDDRLTFFMIPQQLTADATLKIEFTDRLTKTKRTLTASIGGNKKSWESGKLYTYSVSSTGVVVTPIVKLVKNGTEDEFPIDSIPFSGAIRNVKLTAFVRVTQKGTETKDLAVPFKIYSAAGTSGDWVEATWEPNSDNDTFDPKGTTETKTGSLLFQPQPLFSSTLQKDFPRTPRNDIKDLSESESANCYMIHEPGTYKFRTVYGNSLKNGANNAGAYTINRAEGSGDPHPGMKFFADHDNKHITTPYIKDQAGPLKDAFLLWSDSPGLIDLVKLDDTGDYISFRVSPHTIAQGNAVIAVRNADNTIVWSWHIWVTTKNWDTGRIKSRADDGNTYTFAPSTLGYCDAHGSEDERTMKIKFEFDLTDHKGGKLAVTQIGDKKLTFTQQRIIASLAGDNTYYQWGRKDPMVPGIYDRYGYYYFPDYHGLDTEFSMLNKPIFDFDPDYEFTRSPTDNGYNMGQAIQYPHHFIMGIDRESSGDQNYRTHWHTSAGTDYLENDIKNEKGEIIIRSTMYNAWNSTARQYGVVSSIDPRNSQPVTKTIYDPCPAGFNIPAAAAYTGMIHYNRNNSDGTTGKTGYDVDHSWPDNPIKFDERTCSWTLTSNSSGTGEPVRLYATGMRNMNVKNPAELPLYLQGKTFPAYSKVTFICSATLSGGTSQTLILYIDNRTASFHNNPRGSCQGSNNSYGFTVWPVCDVTPNP